MAASARSGARRSPKPLMAAMAVPSSASRSTSAGSSPSASGPSGATTTTPSSSPLSFTALTYNILAKSLGTCAIPWVLPRPSPSLLRRIEAVVDSDSDFNACSSVDDAGGRRRSWRTWDELKNGPIKDEYLTHFHKNFDSGNYAAMRGFWAATTLNGAGDVPGELDGLEWSGEEDRVSYKRGGSSSSKSNGDAGDDVDGEKVTATTLRGVLRRELPDDDDGGDGTTSLALELFDEISSQEEGVYRWDVRGPRIFRAATSIDTAAEGSATNDGGNGAAAAIAAPDLIALQEYDVHSVVADYRGSARSGHDDSDGGGGDGDGEGETFADAMAAAGYDGAFFKDPLRGRTPPSGLGLFWRRGTFAPAFSSTASESEQWESEAPPIMAVLEPDETALGGCLRNADLRETWHPTKNSKSKTNTSLSDGLTLMPPADRRNAALARLRHLPSGRMVLACAVHLMTTSRDSAKTNWYPGEVRAGELAALGKLVRETAKGGDEVLLLGDLNTNALGGEKAGTVPDVFRGQICRAATATSSSSTSPPPDEMLNVDTGFDPSTESFSWGENVRLRDAFSDVHRWGATADGIKGTGNTKDARRRPCTSKNADRSEWIDYAFCSAGLATAAERRSTCEASEGAMPDEEHPSDHLPLWATFEFV